MTNPATRDLVDLECAANLAGRSGCWRAWLRSVSGWVFAIGGDADCLYYFDGPQPPSVFPPQPGWRPFDDGNWSGDCRW